MSHTFATCRRESAIPGVTRKPLDNPLRLKPGASSLDQYAVALLHDVVRQLPECLRRQAAGAQPLLDALSRYDRAAGSDLAYRLLVVGALAHRDADERWVAEYMLRLFMRSKGGQCPAQLLWAARSAAANEARRGQAIERPVAHEVTARWPGTVMRSTPAARLDDASVGETVLAKVPALTDCQPASRLSVAILDAVAIAVALAERHRLKGGRSPALIAMRSDARRAARLVTHLRAELTVSAVAHDLARLLVGPDKTSIDTGLLWWCARADVDIVDVPRSIRSRWRRYLQGAERAIAEPRNDDGSYPQNADSHSSCLQDVPV